MRAFVAVVPPPAALAPLVAAVERLRDAYPGASWVAPERLHLTLAFLGDVGDDQVARLGDGLDALVATPSFRLRVSGGGAFPRPQRPRVLWAGVEGDVDALSRLARGVRRAARAARINVERAPYVPHVTVARVRSASFGGGPDVVAALGAVRGEPWTVDEVVLMRSVLGPKPAYEPLHRSAFS